jgi:hypothetical protein
MLQLGKTAELQQTMSVGAVGGGGGGGGGHVSPAGGRRRSS